jgi:hypothetical protein
MLNPEEKASVFNKDTDAQYAITRTQVCPDHYTAPVEISSYGDKVSILSFGDEAIGMIIDSPQIAEANRQLFNLARLGAEHAKLEK